MRAVCSKFLNKVSNIVKLPFTFSVLIVKSGYSVETGTYTLLMNILETGTYTLFINILETGTYALLINILESTHY